MTRGAAKVLLAEAQPAVREGLARILERDGFEICAAAADAPAIEMARRERPDVAIVSLNIPGDPLRAIAAITELLPRTPVLALTGSRSCDSLVDAVRAGAAGYLLMDMDRQRIPNAVRGVLAGEAAVPRVLVGRLLSEIREIGQARTVRGPAGQVELTRREWEVLNLCAEGLSSGDIASRLGISQVTVRRHVSRACAKLGVGDREAAVELLGETS